MLPCRRHPSASPAIDALKGFGRASASAVRKRAARRPTERAMPQQCAHVLERRLRDELLNGIAADRQSSLFAVYIAQNRLGDY